MIEEATSPPPRRAMSRVGNGPLCPVDPSHGRLYSWDAGGKYFCPHSDHGGNGKFFTEREANGEYELQDQDVSNVFDAAVRDIAAGRTTIDQAVKEVARVTKRSSSSVRESMGVALDVAKQRQEGRTTVADSSKKTQRKQPKAAPAPGEKRRRLEAVEGARFKAVLDEYGLTNKQAAEATGSYVVPSTGKVMGKSSTYIYIITHDGSSIELFKNFEAAIKAYVKENKIRRVKPKAEAKPAAEPEPDAEDDETPVAAPA